MTKNANANGTSKGAASIVEQYTYDYVGNIATITDGNGNVTKYTYDEQNRRLSATYGFGTSTTRTDTWAYDKLNHTLSLGIDRSWRRKAIKWLKPFRPKRIMDVATGTGDFAILACRELQPDELTGIDISEGMMSVGREKVKQAHLSDKISFVREDCTSLSFAGDTFDAVTVAFGIRNFEGLDKGLAVFN